MGRGRIPHTKEHPFVVVRFPGYGLGWELVGFAFFDTLSLAHRRIFGPRQSARSRQLLDALGRRTFE